VEFKPPDNALYTLLSTSRSIVLNAVVDPDAPSRRNPIFRSWVHWVVTDIPHGKIRLGRQLTYYTGPAPPQATGLHRVHSMRDKLELMQVCVYFGAPAWKSHGCRRETRGV
jgi:phosphatidylethanolamine-binding protein (PEBP) family uncharacterized protein